MSHRVVALALPGLITFDLSCLVQIFGCVPDLDGDEPRRYDFVVCGPGGRKVRTSDGFDLAVSHDLTALGGRERLPYLATTRRGRWPRRRKS